MNYAGLWRRSLLVLPDGQRDTTTNVNWLQGPQLFADLRQPPARPDCADPAHLSMQAALWLASQAGFAGEFHLAGNIAEWRREIDFQPPSLVPDAGLLDWQGDILVETGLHSPYLEHWHRDTPAPPGCGLRLQSREDGRLAILVRSGAHFILARDRAPGVPLPHPSLAACVAAAADAPARLAVLDCEISFGHAAQNWRIAASTLPWREGAHIPPALRGPLCTIAGIAWDVLNVEGDSMSLFEVPA